MQHDATLDGVTQIHLSISFVQTSTMLGWYIRACVCVYFYAHTLPSRTFTLRDE